MTKTSSLIARNMISVDLKSRHKDSVLEEIVRHVAKVKKIRNEKALLATLHEREAKGTTGIGNGIAIPHARMEGLKDVVFFVGVSRGGIDFAAIDGKPVQVVFLFLTPQADTETHLKILSRISGLAGNKSLIRKMLAAETDEGLYDVLRAEELDVAGFMSLTDREIFLELDTGPDGLTDEEAGKRLLAYGENKLKQMGKKSLLKRFLYNFTNQLALLMWVGSALAFLVSMPEVGWAIIAVIFINAFFSYWQEFRAERAIDALKKLIPSYARCVRGGKEQQVLADELVPGDIIQLDEGDNIAADARLVEAHDLRVDNSVFSGESKPSYKTSEVFKNGKNFLWTELPNLIFAGTSVVSGDGRAVVIATGMSTEIGQIAYLTQTVKEDISPLQREIGRLTKVITLVAVIMGAAFFFVGTSLAKMSFAAAAIFAIGIILGNVPEGLMPTVTMALALGVQRMAKRHALIKKLSSVETLGCTDVICTDKTGTLTTNQMCVRKIWINGKVVEVAGSGYEPEGEFSCCGSRYLPEEFGNDRIDLLMWSGILCSTAKLSPPSEEQPFWTIVGDPTEASLLVMAKKAGFDIDGERSRYPYLKRFSFEAVRKRMSTVHRMPDGSLTAFVKGAPKEVVELSTRIAWEGKVVELTAALRARIGEQIDIFAREGLRILGLAYRELGTPDAATMEARNVERELVFVGIAAMYDPPRPEVAPALEICQRAGIRVVMITGDYQLTALTIARQVGIVRTDSVEVITGVELEELSDEVLRDRIRTKEVIFARVNPEHKLRVVTAFKDLGNIVAVTGDGVNDAPALKKADIGVAMGIRGTDVAKAASEMILTDDNFASIVAAIEEGRAVFDNIKKFVTYIFAHLIPEAVPFIFFALLKIPVPITAMQILAIDLGTETLPALALGSEKPEPGIMDRPPRPRNKGIVDKIVLYRGYVFFGLLNSAAVLAAYFLVLYRGGWSFGRQLEPNEITFTNPLHLKAMTVLFAGIVVMQIANVFGCRSDTFSSFKLGFFKNRLILWGILFELAFLGLLVYTPVFQKVFQTTAIGWKAWVVITAFMVSIFFLEELRKWLLSRRRRRAGA